MEKFGAARIKKVRNNIHDDLAFPILSKLPLKSVKRFVCIRKSWAIFCETPNFMNMFRRNFLLNNQSYYDDSSLIIYHTMNNDLDFALYSLFGERCENIVRLDCPTPFQEDKHVFNIVGYCSINGIFCLNMDYELNGRVVLWNPATEELKIIPSSPLELAPIHYRVELNRVGFGYDCFRDDYKVIRRVKYIPESESDCRIDNLESEYISYDIFWEIYSLNGDSWKKICADNISYYEALVVYVDGACHWFGEYGFYDKTYLVSFDMRKEEFIITPTPLDEKNYFDNFLSVLNGYVALISNHFEDTTFHISILGEIGVMESWVKLFTIGPLPCIVYPIGVGKKGIFFRKDDGKLTYLDLSTHAIVELGVIGDGSSVKVLNYKASLLPIGFSSWNNVAY